MMLNEPNTASILLQATAVLNICTSCRPKGMPRDPAHERPGYQLYMTLRDIIAASPLADSVCVQPVSCMSLCPRPCAISFASQGRWSYLFGDQHCESAATDVPACLEHYLHDSEGKLPREGRPMSLRASILGRVPPLDVNSATAPDAPGSR